MMDNIKITKEDKFVWHIISSEVAKAIFCYGNMDIYKLYDDESESLIETFEDIESSIQSKMVFGIEIGFLDDIIKSANEE